MFTYIPKTCWHHYFEAGPEREKTHGNPTKPGEYHPERQRQEAPEQTFRETYPVADDKLLQILPSYSYFADIYELTIPRIKSDGTIRIESYPETDEGPNETFTIEEYIHILTAIDGNAEEAWDNAENLRKYLN